MLSKLFVVAVALSSSVIPTVAAHRQHHPKPAPISTTPVAAAPTDVSPPVVEDPPPVVEDPPPVTNSTGPGYNPPATGGLGTAYVINQCDYPIWIWSINGPNDSGKIPVAKRDSHHEPMQLAACEGCGTVFKVSKTEQLVDGFHTQFEYAINKTASVMYYDVSYVNCAKGEDASNCPGHEGGHGIDASEPACDKLNCPAGTFCPTQAYYVDTPLIKMGIEEPVYGCGDKGISADLHFIMCSDGEDMAVKRSVAEPKVETRSVAGRVHMHKRHGHL